MSLQACLDFEELSLKVELCQRIFKVIENCSSVSFPFSLSEEEGFHRFKLLGLILTHIEE